MWGLYLNLLLCCKQRKYILHWSICVLQLHSPYFACLNIHLLQIKILLSKTEHSIAGLANLWHACRKWHAERFPWYVAFTAVPIFFISFAWPVSPCCEEYVYIYTCLIAWRECVNCLRYQIILWVKHFYTNREQCGVLTGYLSCGHWPGGDWANTWHYMKCFRIFFLNSKE
jgi:hypothetical protein